MIRSDPVLRRTLRDYVKKVSTDPLNAYLNSKPKRKLKKVIVKKQTVTNNVISFDFNNGSFARTVKRCRVDDELYCNKRIKIN